MNYEADLKMRLFLNLNKIIDHIKSSKKKQSNNILFVFSNLYKKFFKLFQSFQNNIQLLEEKFKKECHQYLIELDRYLL